MFNEAESNKCAVKFETTEDTSLLSTGLFGEVSVSMKSVFSNLAINTGELTDSHSLCKRIPHWFNHALGGHKYVDTSTLEPYVFVTLIILETWELVMLPKQLPPSSLNIYSQISEPGPHSVFQLI